MSTPIDSNPYTRVGAVDSNYLAAALPQSSTYLFKGAQFNNYNCADRLGGFFINTLAGIHAKVEVPSLRERLTTKVARATVDSYIDHLKADGDGILAAIATFRNFKNGSQRSAYANELSQSCGRYSLLATTANYNFAFVHTSAKQAVYTAGFHNQQTDFWQGSSKFFWFRAEKHFQIQAATASRYITESVEDIYNAQREVSNTRASQIGSWKITSADTITGSFDIDLPETIVFKSQSLQVKTKSTVNINGAEINLDSSSLLTIAASDAVTISGAQIFLSANIFADPVSLPTQISAIPVLPIAPIETLNAYPRQPATANQQQPVVMQGTTAISQPPI